MTLNFPFCQLVVLDRRRLPLNFPRPAAGGLLADTFMQPGNLPKRSPKRPDGQTSLSRVATLRPTKRANRTLCRPKIDNTDSSSQVSDVHRGIFDVIGHQGRGRIAPIAIPSPARGPDASQRSGPQLRVMRQSRHPCPIVRHGAWLAANSQPARTITEHRIGAARVASAGVVAGFASSKDPAGLFGGTPRRFQSSGAPVVHDLFCGRLASRPAPRLAAEWCGHVDAAAALARCSRAHGEDGAFVVPAGEPGDADPR